MLSFNETECAELKAIFEKTHNSKVHLVYLRSIGIRRKELTGIFLVSLATVTNYCNLYKSKGIKGLVEKHYKGSSCRLSVSQQEDVQRFLEENYEGFRPTYRNSLIFPIAGQEHCDWAHRLGYVTKKRSGYLVKRIPMSKRPS